MDKNFLKIVKIYFMLFFISSAINVIEIYINIPKTVYIIHAAYIMITLLISSIIFLSNKLKNKIIIILLILTVIINCMNFLTAINTENFL